MKILHDLWQDPAARELIGLLALLLTAWVASALARFLLFRVLHRLAERTSWHWDDALFEHGVFRWVARMAPLLVIELGIGMVGGLPAVAVALVGHAALGAIVFCAAMAASALVSAAAAAYQRLEQGQRHPVKGLAQLAKLVVFVIAGLVLIGVLTDKNIGLLLSGLGAMSAVLILVFKDTLLGLVAGLQLASNDMLRVGDRITMPAAGADGHVVDITLYTVKVRNFDNTIVTIPTWRMVADSYQNWRGMVESGGRRIKRALWLDASRVHFLDEAALVRLRRLHLLHDPLAGVDAQLGRRNDAPGEAGAPAASRLTNLGAFRAYARAYAWQHPAIHRGMTCLVRQLEAQGQGVPLELWCFTTATAFEAYEAVQAEIFDHLIAILPEFGLRLFQQPTGRDVRVSDLRVSLAAPHEGGHNGRPLIDHHDDGARLPEPGLESRTA
ncbi:mechanosensitive ion channel family protein [Frateuria defendens]|uniref:mechanosensitive ion channel family protein n=1 Tax=Frateuria defendens TaxID=2219559 RepID=UPI0007DC34ED|nr:mechanosensitive ion channel domain-containing protein [Frateuria defendens]